MSTVLLELVARILIAPMLLIALALLVGGYAGPGGGFAAGAVAGVAAVLLRVVSGRGVVARAAGARARHAALAGGVGLALATSLAPLAAGDPLLTHYPRPGAAVTSLGAIELHTGLLFELGVALVVFAFVVEAEALVAPGREGE